MGRLIAIEQSGYLQFEEAYTPDAEVVVPPGCGREAREFRAMQRMRRNVAEAIVGSDGR